MLHGVKDVSPKLPDQLPRGMSRTFNCRWNWANYTGQTIEIIVSIVDGSGATFQAETPLVDLTIKPHFNSTIGITHFNVTIKSSNLSKTYVNITRLTVDKEAIENLKPSLPYTLHPNASVTLMCTWNWIKYQGKNVTIAVHTLQGYARYHTETTPPPVILTITKVLFNITDTNHFNVTIHNSDLSPTFVNINKITVTMENGTIREITKVNPPLTPPYTLHPNASVTLMCTWNWTDYLHKNVTVTVYTLQGYVVSLTQTTPASSGASSSRKMVVPTQEVAPSTTWSKSLMMRFRIKLRH